MISIIVAASENDVIGRQGELPWRLSDDLKHFKALTMGKPIIMGRKTWESIGRPLPGRQNIVVTRQRGFGADGCDVVASLEDAVTAAGDADEIVVIGGSQIYALALPLAQRLYLTRVHADVEGDASFPAVDATRWCLVADEHHEADDRNEHDFSFRVYDRAT
jgi:dihydrofolate reductase